MQGRTSEQPPLFTQINLETFVPESHVLRRLDRVLDLSFIEEATAGFYVDKKGRPSIPPELFFRMQIIYYLYGVKSERQLCEQIHLNLAFRWFCRLGLEDVVPDHSSMTRIRDRFGEALFKEVFEGLVDKYRKQGLVKGQRLIADSSLVEADASIDTLIEVDGIKKSIADQDATLVGRAKFSGHVYHKNHLTIDADSRIITDTYATTGSRQDCTVLCERVDYHVERGFAVKEVIADAGYGTGPILEHLARKQIDAFMPITDRTNGAKKALYRDGFHYSWDENRIRCPMGHYLYPHRKIYRGAVKFRMLGGHCKGCPMENQCLPPTQKHRALFIDLSIHEKYLELARRKMGTEVFKERLLERKWKIEGLFGEAKTQHGLRRAKMRGRAKVQIQFYVIAIVQNYKRVMGLYGPNSYLQKLLHYFLRIFSLQTHTFCFHYPK